MEPGISVHDVPPFAEASARMSAFLRGQGAPESIVWVFREEVTSFRRQVWVRAGARREAQSAAAEACFEKGRERGLGVAIRGVCQVEGATACYVWVPKDSTEAEYALQPPSLKLAVPTPLVKARIVRSALRWRWLRWLNASPPVGDALIGEVPNCPARTGRAEQTV